MTVAEAVMEDLRAVVGAPSFLTGQNLDAYRLAGKTPRAAARPAHEGEVSQILKLAWEADLGVIPWGGGCHQSIGYLPTRYDLALDLTRLNSLVAHEPGDMTATAQAGMRMLDLQCRLGEHGQFLPLDTPMPERVTLGGMLATRLAGPLRCRYGTARDLILGARVAQADGTVTMAGAKVVKNATGYDVTKLYLGSHGTLGVILEATFRLYPRPKVERGWWLSVCDLDVVQTIANRILNSHLIPDRVELLDDGAGRSCGLSGPGLVMSLSGLPETVEGQQIDLGRMVGDCGVTLTELGDSKNVWRNLSNFPWQSPGGEDGDLRALWRGGVVPGDCAKAIQAIQAETRQMQVGIAATVSHGALRGYIRARTPVAIVNGLRAARQALIEMGGYLVVMDIPESVRGDIDVWGTTPDGLGVMRRLKTALDAKDVLNPGRFIGGI